MLRRSRIWILLLSVILLRAVTTGIPQPCAAADPMPTWQFGQGHPVLRDFFSPEEMAKWKDYRLTRLRMSLTTMASVVLFYVLFLLFGLNRRLKKVAEAWSGRLHDSPHLQRLAARLPALRRAVKVPERLFGGSQWLVVLLYCLLFFMLLEVCFLPATFYRSFWYEVHHGLSNLTAALWFSDWLKGLILNTLLDTSMVFGIYGLLARVGRRWWLLLGAGVSVAIFGWVVIAPYRSMLFSHYRSLEAGEVRTRLENLAQDQGLALEDILVVDASRRTKAVNAYIQGTGPTRRMVLYDNLLQQFTPREITMIFAHEMVHWKYPPSKLQYLGFSLTVFVVLFLVNRMLERGSRIRWLHYSGPQDVASLPLLFLTFYLIFTLIKPLNLYWRRSHELETDRKSLEMVCDPEAYVQVQVKLARLNRDYVDAPSVVVYLCHSHPPFLERLSVALDTNCAQGSLGSVP